MIYKKYTGSDKFVAISSQDNDSSITVIGAKAFLSCKQIEKLVLPATITTIEDWAFSHMHSLQELEMPANPIRFGKQVFLGSNKLQRVCLFPDYSGNPGLPFFMANTAVIFSNMNLFDPVRAASKTEHLSWMQDYDALLIDYLNENDLTGFEPVFYGWVNDEDADVSQKPQYLYRQRFHKVYLTFQRLTYSLHLTDRDREILCAYLRDHMPWGSKSSEHTAVWDLLPAHYSQDVQTYRILEEAGALPTEHIPALVEHLSAASPEVIAWLLRCQEQNREEYDFFDMLSI